MNAYDSSVHCICQSKFKNLMSFGYNAVDIIYERGINLNYLPNKLVYFYFKFIYTIISKLFYNY